MSSVLLVEDEPGIRVLVRDQLQDNGLHVTVATTAKEAEAELALRSFTVVILDLTLPDGSGFEILDRLHASQSTSHVIILSGSTAEADRVHALQAGADDFVVKPFYVRELTARVLAVGRRRDPNADAVLAIGRLVIDLRARQVTAAGEEVELTGMEFDLLAYLAVRPGHVFDREQLLNAVWQSASEWQQAATVTEHIRRLRAKLEVDPADPQLLVTVRGSGYRLDLPVDDAEDVVPSQKPATAPESGSLIHVDGRIVFCDQAAADILGARAPAVVGQHLIDLVAPTTLAAARDRFAGRRAGQSQRSELIELRHGATDHVTTAVKSSPVDWHGQPARRLRLDLVTEGPARLRRLVTGVLGDLADAVIIADLHFHIRSWNAAAERLYGWQEQEVMGRHILDVLHWAGDNQQLPEIWERLEHTGRWHGESKHLGRDGSVVEVLGSTSLIRDDAGEPVGIVTVNRAAAEARHMRSVQMDATAIARLRQGLDGDQFQVHYQPVVDLADGRLLIVEALVRWEHPERGTLPPAEFLEIAERSGLIVELGERVLDQACRQVAEWRRAGADISLSVNVSTRQLVDPWMVERFTSILRNSGLDPSFLWLEVTETAIVEELETTSLGLQRLVDLGIGVVIDDFGTGWASLTYLRSFPVHAIKIDQSFVAGAGHKANDTAIVRSMLSLGDELDLFVVAEGIETTAQHRALTELGCSIGQGYLFGRPTAAHAVPIDRAGRVEADAPLIDGASPTHLAAVSASARGPDLRGSGVAVVDSASAPRERPRPNSLEPGRLTTIAGDVESDVVANLLRGLLRIRSARAAAALLQQTVLGMGGVPVPAAAASEHALPVDVSLGEGPPMVVEVERLTVARMQLERLLPRLVEDARQSVHLLRQTERHPAGTERDELTGLDNRRVLDRVLFRATSGSVVMLSLDHFKDVSDAHGQAASDAVLVSFGMVLTAQVRAQDTSCRIGTDEFALVLTDADVDGAVELVDRIRLAWASAVPRAVTFSAGIAPIGTAGGAAALLAADRALYAAKDLGPDRTELAAPSTEPTES